MALIHHDSLGPVRLGASRDEIRRALGPPSHTQEPHEQWGIHFHAKDYFFDNALQVSYDDDQVAEFIEASHHDSFVVTFDGVPVHSSPAEEVLATIRRHAKPDEDDREYPCNQTFPALDLTIYREHREDAQIEAIGIGRLGYTSREG
ncbi:MAG: hypothetical protein HYZ53_25575 [Planctomycetes bacterium]|nr:hypothetical protein [Planctomycetota bacterium]